jgi:hypothetical protein
MPYHSLVLQRPTCWPAPRYLRPLPDSHQLMVVVPAMTAIASSTAAGQAAAAEMNPEAMESASDWENLFAFVPRILSALLFSWAVRAVQAEAMRAKWVRADQFAKSIMLNLEDFPGSDGMKFMRDVIDLEKGIKRDVILWNVTTPFLNECIEFLSEPRYRPRLCVVGTPGVARQPGLRS